MPIGRPFQTFYIDTERVACEPVTIGDTTTVMAMAENIIHFDRKALTQAKLIRAVGALLAKQGFKGLGVNKVAREAGVDKVLVYRYFGGLPELVKAYSLTVDFWPTVSELMGPDPDRLRNLQPDQQVAEFFKSYIAALRKRPVTQDILAWEMLERNELSRQLEDVRIRTFLEYFERLEEIPDDENLTAVVVLMASAVTHLIAKARIHRSYGGIDLESEKGWERIYKGIDVLLRGIFPSS
jgi:AcrR family transcriptional regulator